jgi:hypothetical protein
VIGSPTISRVLQSTDFHWDEYWWKTQLVLSAWPGSVRNPPGTDPAEIDIVFAPEGRDDSPLTEHETALVRWFIANQVDVFGAVSEALTAWYVNVRSDYLQFVSETDLPDELNPANVSDYLRLLSVNVHNVYVGDMPYLGFEFAATWEPEHGVGVLTHGTRVVEIGGADTAILRWIAQRDAGSH